MEFPDTLIKEGTLSCVDYLQMSGVSGNSTDTLAEGLSMDVWNDFGHPLRTRDT